MGSSDAFTRRLLYCCALSPLSLWERAGVREPTPVWVPRWLLALCLLGCLGITPAISSAETWQEKTSTHFRVFYQQNPAFATAVLAYAEGYYNQIRLDLGLTHVVQRDQVPWLWDKRCQIYLYPDRQAYRQATGAPAWSGGFVNYQRRMVYSHLGVSSFLEQTLPHELAHIIFREFVGFDNNRIPRWLDEGVAQYAELNRREETWDVMRQGLTQGIYIPLDQLNALHVGHASGGAAHVFYTQAATLVQFFLAAYGPRRFLDFCSNLRDGYSVERALSFATGGSIASLSALEDAWRMFLLSDF
jgi:Peptidase MA superfamily